MTSSDTAARGRGERALVAAIRGVTSDGMLRAWWLGQSGFVVRVDDAVAVIDPYLSDSLTRKYAATPTPHVRLHDRVIAPEILAEVPVSVVLSTHQHTDHLDPDTLGPLLAACRKAGRPAPLVAPEAWRTLAADRAGLRPADIIGMDDGVSRSVGGFAISAVAAAHDTLDRDEAGHAKYLGYVLRAGRWAVFHGGDGVPYDGLAERLRSCHLDLAFLPINGKVGNMSGREAAMLARAAGVGLVVPCHYDMFAFNTADPTVEFAPVCAQIGQSFRVLPLGEGLAIDHPAEERA